MIKYNIKGIEQLNKINNDSKGKIINLFGEELSNKIKNQELKILDKYNNIDSKTKDEMLKEKLKDYAEKINLIIEPYNHYEHLSFHDLEEKEKQIIKLKEELNLKERIIRDESLKRLFGIKEKQNE